MDSSKGNEMNEIQQMIQTTANGLIDEWTSEAQDKGQDTELYICDQLDALEETEPEVSAVVGQTWLARRFAVA